MIIESHQPNHLSELTNDYPIGDSGGDPRSRKHGARRPNPPPRSRFQGQSVLALRVLPARATQRAMIFDLRTCHSIQIYSTSAISDIDASFRFQPFLLGKALLTISVWPKNLPASAFWTSFRATSSDSNSMNA